MLTVSILGTFSLNLYAIAGYLRDLLELQKKGTERHRMIRNALIVYLAKVEEMLIPNIAEEAGVSIYTVKNAIKASKNTSEQEKKVEALEEKWSRQRRIRVQEEWLRRRLWKQWRGLVSEC